MSEPRSSPATAARLAPTLDRYERDALLAKTRPEQQTYMSETGFSQCADADSATLSISMSALNGDKARFHRERKAKLARRERSQTLRKKLTKKSEKRPSGRDL